MKYEIQNKYNDRQNKSRLVVTQYKLVAAKRESLKRVRKIGERVQKAQRYKLEKKKNRSRGLKYSMWHTANDIYLLTLYDD